MFQFHDAVIQVAFHSGLVFDFTAEDTDSDGRKEEELKSECAFWCWYRGTRTEFKSLGDHQSGFRLVPIVISFFFCVLIIVVVSKSN